MNIIYKCIIGSTAFNTRIETSDTDVSGVYFDNPIDVLRGNTSNNIKFGKDEVYQNINFYLSLLTNNNISFLEMLFSSDDMVLKTTPIFELLRTHKKSFLTKNLRHAYLSYGKEQLNKFRGHDKMMTWDENRTKRKGVLDFCYTTVGTKSIPLLDFLNEKGIDHKVCGVSKLNNQRDNYLLYYNPNRNYKGVAGDNSNQLRLSDIEKDLMPICLFSYNKDAYTVHCKDYAKYLNYIKNRNVDRYFTMKDGKSADAKNLAHAYRLILSAKNVITYGEIRNRFDGSERETLIKIRTGNANYETVLNDIEQMISELEPLYEASTLPSKFEDWWIVDEVKEMVFQEQLKLFKNV